jgi:hypothetical protein
MGRFEDTCFLEDVDTSGGPAAIESALNHYGGYQAGGTADEIRSPPGQGRRIVRIMTADETPNTAAAYGDLAIDGRRGGDISLPLCKAEAPGITILPGGGIPWPPNTDINCLANASGGGAEQHCIVLRVWNPNGQSGFVTKPAPPEAEACIYEMPTDANTADTLDNPVDICGRLNAYTNGQAALPDDPRVEIWLHAIDYVLPDGQSGIYLLPPGREHAYIYCAPDTTNQRVDFVQEFGAPLYCNGATPILIGSVGTATTLIPTVLHMSVLRPTGVD